MSLLEHSLEETDHPVRPFCFFATKSKIKTHNCIRFLSRELALPILLDWSICLNFQVTATLSAARTKLATLQTQSQEYQRLSDALQLASHELSLLEQRKEEGEPGRLQKHLQDLSQQIAETKKEQEEVLEFIPLSSSFMYNCYFVSGSCCCLYRSLSVCVLVCDSLFLFTCEFSTERGREIDCVEEEPSSCCNKFGPASSNSEGKADASPLR